MTTLVPTTSLVPATSALSQVIDLSADTDEEEEAWWTAEEEDDGASDSEELTPQDSGSQYSGCEELDLEARGSTRKRSVSEPPADSPSKRQKIVVVADPPLLHSKQSYEGCKPDEVAVSERRALNDLLQSTPQTCDDEYTIVSLQDFRVYLPSSNESHAYELRSLSSLKTRIGHSTLAFDGILQFGSQKRIVRGVEFELLCIDGYGTNEASVQKKTCIVSKQSKSRNVWYLLGNPAQDYERFWHPFCSLVDLAKHFVAFLDAHKNVKLDDFRFRFNDYLETLYGNNCQYREWSKGYDRTDFRTDIVAHIEFLWKEATDVQEAHQKHSLWKEIDRKQMAAIPAQPNKEKNTIVTPYVYKCFQQMYFSECLEERAPSPDVLKLQGERQAAFDRAIERNQTSDNQNDNLDGCNGSSLTTVRKGDVIALERDEKTVWKESTKYWYAYVQDLETLRSGKTKLHLIWLYAPSDTVLSTMTYPSSDELFFSDHCTCHKSNRPTFLSDVLQKVSVSFFSTEVKAGNQFFVRQKYITDQEDRAYASIVTLHQSDLKCSCRSSEAPLTNSFPVGTTVLMRDRKTRYLEPVVVESLPDEEMIKIRRLLRRNTSLKDTNAMPNELVFTNNVYEVPASDLIRRCHVRFAKATDARKKALAGAYRYGGVADCWTVTGELSEGGEVAEIDAKFQADMIQGFDPLSKETPCMKGLGLFCGGGNLDRGLGESGAIDFKWAADWGCAALHTYRANRKKPSSDGLFLGNINDLLARALSLERNILIPGVGEVDFISGGSPCVAFSGMQPDKLSKESLRNASLVASLASFVDLYRPAYGLFENVFGMAARVSKDRNENVLSQLLCCFVGMGYQVSLINSDAWSNGHSQSRRRLFISIAAPGLPTIPQPPQTHSHPAGTRDSSLGKAANGERFGLRRFEPTPFKHISAREATADLPPLFEGANDVCIRFPDHRLSSVKKTMASQAMRNIPRFPFGSSYIDALALGKIPASIAEYYGRRSKLWKSRYNKAFTRIRPDRVFPTILTKATPACAKNGFFVHWDEPRQISIMEARRAQGIPDEEVLVGGPPEQFKIVGNSVARYVAVAFGVELRMVLEQCHGRNSLFAQCTGMSKQSAGKSSDLSIIPPVVQSVEKKRYRPITIPDSEDDTDSGSDSIIFVRSQRLPDQNALSPDTSFEVPMRNK